LSGEPGIVLPLFSESGGVPLVAVLLGALLEATLVLFDPPPPHEARSMQREAAVIFVPARNMDKS
jgi:hypothetical protein